jgi:hypothetical protein
MERILFLQPNVYSLCRNNYFQIRGESHIIAVKRVDSASRLAPDKRIVLRAPVKTSGLTVRQESSRLPLLSTAEVYMGIA